MVKRKEEEKLIYMYSIKHLLKKDKVRFYYALKGRTGKEGIIKSANIEQLGKGVLMVPLKHEKDFNDFMSFWKCKFKKKRVIER